MYGMISVPLYNVDCKSIGFNGLAIAVSQVKACIAGGNAIPFNLGLNVQDDSREVIGRRNQVAAVFGAPIQWLDQVHGNQVFNLDAQVEPSNYPCMDASVTVCSNVALAVLTADCLPVVFFVEGRRRAIGVAHAGWKGLAAGILENTCQRLAEVAQADVAMVRAWMGPAIGPDSFEVGPEVRAVFLDHDRASESCFVPSANPGKWMADLYSLARLRMQALSVQAIGGDADTFNDFRYFSHRRSQRFPDQPSGRFATLVRLLP